MLRIPQVIQRKQSDWNNHVKSRVFKWYHVISRDLTRHLTWSDVISRDFTCFCVISRFEIFWIFFTLKIKNIDFNIWFDIYSSLQQFNWIDIQIAKINKIQSFRRALLYSLDSYCLWLKLKICLCLKAWFYISKN